MWVSWSAVGNVCSCIALKSRASVTLAWDWASEQFPLQHRCLQNASLQSFEWFLQRQKPKGKGGLGQGIHHLPGSAWQPSTSPPQAFGWGYRRHSRTWASLCWRALGTWNPCRLGHPRLANSPHAVNRHHLRTLWLLMPGVTAGLVSPGRTRAEVRGARLPGPLCRPGLQGASFHARCHSGSGHCPEESFKPCPLQISVRNC